ncbi:MAG TPA: hypothetical protein VER12_04535 [Polyangiaceae bacterium]|nr:hypothetical protein [Polyangiaceae bacterium]
MSFGFKVIVPCTLGLYLASACAPDLDSLSASYSSSGGGSSGSGTVEDGGTGNSTSIAGGGSAPVDLCTNGKKESNESDVDCGGTSKCERCTKGADCKANRDCESEYCMNGHCTAASCTDELKNQGETGVDCGGPCLPCDTGVSCDVNADCTGSYCHDKVCADHCTSGIKESDETGPDCGGETCDACGDGIGCKEAGDCKSKICSNNKCQKATCSDQVQNQDESDKDCGGVCASSAKACGVGLHCNSEADCESWICSSTTGKCIADTVVVAAEDIIDDFEDGNLTLPALGGRVGGWYNFGDGTGVGSGDTAIINRGPSKEGLRIKGKDFTNWGSGMGTDMQPNKVPYNASAFAGVTFWARAETTLTLGVIFPDIDTDPGGKLCTTCDHHYNKGVQVNQSWQRFTVNFADLVLEPGTLPAPTMFKPDGLVSVQFRFAPGQTYEVYVDDLAFIKKP